MIIENARRTAGIKCDKIRPAKGRRRIGEISEELMKTRIGIVLLFIAGVLVLAAGSRIQNAAPEDRTVADVIVLAEKAALGKVTFKHGDHINLKHNADGTANLSCVDCHHVEQAKAEGKKVYPADRTVTLTAETWKDGTAPAVTSCQTCHLPKDGTPTILTEVPKSGTTVLNNQNALHRACATCHEQVVKARPTVVAPTAMKCVGCHKKA